MSYYADDQSSFLSHHGIIGQKWGVRRFQNKDGSLTKAGKERYQTTDGRLNEEGKALAKSFADTVPDTFGKAGMTEEQAKRAGISIGNKSDRIKKGSEFTRLAGEEDKIDDKRKYVSLTKWDNDQYESDYEFLPMEGAPTQFKYEAIKDLKVAKSNEVVDYLMNKYGDTTISDLEDRRLNYLKFNYTEDLVKEYGSITMKELHAAAELNNKTRHADAVPDWLKNRSELLDDAYRSFIDQQLMTKGSKSAQQLYNDFKKRGYDAVVDPEDYGSFQYPVILLNPKTSIKQKSKKALKDVWAERYG